MAWSYDATDLGTGTVSGRLNSVRLLVGDTDTNDQQVQNEEVIFALAQTSVGPATFQIDSSCYCGHFGLCTFLREKKLSQTCWDVGFVFVSYGV